MKYGLRAAAAALAFTLVPGALLAGSSSGWAVATSFDSSSSTVRGLTKDWSEVALNHISGTSHTYVADALMYPPGPTREIAIRWNLAVFQNKPKSTFDRLLQRSAKSKAAITFVRSDSPNPDGTYDLISVAPSQ